MAFGCGEAGRLCLAALAGALYASPLLADDEDDEPDPHSIVFFGSMEAGPSKTFISYGSKQALNAGGLDTSGFRLMNKLGGSRERASTVRPYGRLYKAEAQFLLGYELRYGDNFLAAYVGPEIEGEYGEVWWAYYGIARVSARVQAELWMTPSETTMAQLSAYASGLDRRIWGRLALGQKIDRGLYLGPEVELYRQIGYDKLRLGLHLTGLRLFGATWRLSGGLEDTSDRAVGAYATLGVHWTADNSTLPATALLSPFQRGPQVRP